MGFGLAIGSFLFFFQAGDGIRDLYVTGVQTCALPILDDRPVLSAREARTSSDACRGPPPRPRRPSSSVLPPPSVAAQRSSAALALTLPASLPEIGRASCRERGETWVVAVAWIRCDRSV